MSWRRKRSSTDQSLLPSSDPQPSDDQKRIVYPDVVSWTFNRASVIWTIWPAVLLHTTFAIVVTSISLYEQISLGIPPILTTVLGVVIGFVISYRTSSGYERYWMGRVAWSDIIRNARTISRFIWIHAPLQIDADASSDDTTHAEQCMREKRLALGLVEGFAVAVKHHLRGELGIYYEDLYPLVKPLHKKSRQKQRLSEENPSENAQAGNDCPYFLTLSLDSESSDSKNQTLRSDSSSSHSSSHDNGHPHILPSCPRHPPRPRVLIELIPFASFCLSVASMFRQREKKPKEFVINSDDLIFDDASDAQHRFVGSSGRKFKPVIAGGGKNIPLQILHCLSEWLCTLEERNTVSMNAIVGMYANVSAFEDSLTTLERILTTPLPFAYSAQILQCVWLYLFLLPFQIVEEFRWFTVPAVTIAAWFFLGFIAAGEELEQPFGYDENDLDLDLFCRDIIHAEIDALKKTYSPNVVLSGSPVGSADSSVPRRPRRLSTFVGKRSCHPAFLN